MTWKKLSEKIAYKGWRQIKVKEFELPDGRITTYDIFSSQNFVTVAAWTAAGEAILVRQFRPGPERELLSFCEGAIDPGEEPEVTARRELLEETGYEAGELIFLKKRYSAYTDQTQYFFVAIDCRPVQAPQPDAGEFINLEIMALEAFKKLLRDPQDALFNNIDAAYLALDYIDDLML